ncbi:flagellar hook-length control protein FliK [Sphingobium sp.]|uniref:flagellar hook-length control protein FliK n=1 Tax=Sphingobium sp. TaxID=1912891 RepID=UPI002C6226B7|nr:flagellar hook-length control protein FliK [Sphingobium sp.]HUD91820.1 flagellar hook-length control protein FliK [Sphingobium sp.]
MILSTSVPVQAMASQEPAPTSDPIGAFGVLVDNLSVGSPETPTSMVPTPSRPPVSLPSGDAADQPLLPVAPVVEAEAALPSQLHPEVIGAPTATPHPSPSPPVDPATTEAPDEASLANDEQAADSVRTQPVFEKPVALHGASLMPAVQPGLAIERPVEKVVAKKEEAAVDEAPSDREVHVAVATRPQPVSMEMIPTVVPPPATGGDGLVPDDGATQQSTSAQVTETGGAETILPKTEAVARADTPTEPKGEANTADLRSIAAPAGTERQREEVGMEVKAVAMPPHIAKADGALPSPLLTQTLAPVTNTLPASPYPVTPQAVAPSPVIQAQPGRIGADIGVEIAKAAKGDREDLLIRLDPREMGRIDVRLSFDREGTLRAVMSADSPAALDMLRRESGDLNRALVDAGIRQDSQSLRFDARSGDQGQGAGSGQGWQHGGQDQGNRAFLDNGGDELADLEYRPLRASGQVDLMA